MVFRGDIISINCPNFFVWVFSDACYQWRFKYVNKKSNCFQLSKKNVSFVNEKVCELLHAGVIEESRSPWRHNPVIVAKKDGSSRMTINYKPVNSVTKFDAYPLPKIDTLIANLKDAKFFSTLDFSQFYHQLPLVEKHPSKHRVDSISTN